MGLFGNRAQGLRLERMRSSPLWGGDRFHNVHPTLPGLRDPNARVAFSQLVRGDKRRAPAKPLPCVNPLEVWPKAPGSGLRATWLGHSTVLIEIDGLRVLTDPVWGSRASPSSFVGPKRFQPVPVPLSSLPPIDVVLISHDHYDHLDRPTIRELAKRDVPFVMPLGVGAHLEAWGVGHQFIHELDWWETFTLPGSELTITAGPAQHSSGRGLHDQNATLWSSMIIRSPRHSAFFSGDTGLTTEFATVRERFGPFDLLMLEVGAFHPSWGDLHLGPENALEALSLLGGGTLLPVHWATFSLALHDWDEPAELLQKLAPKRGANLLMPRLGEPVEPAHAQDVVPWWRAVDQPAGARKSASPALSYVTNP